MGLGNCYQAAGDAILEDLSDWTLCHGIVTGNGGEVEGRAYDHAWVERGDYVIDRSNGQFGLPLRREFYYGMGDCRDVKRYTRDEAIGLMCATGHYGPWED